MYDQSEKSWNNAVVDPTKVFYSGPPSKLTDSFEPHLLAKYQILAQILKEY